MVRYYTTQAAATAAGFKTAETDVEKVPVIGKLFALPLKGINAIIKGVELKSIRRKRREADVAQAVATQPTSAVFQPGV